MPVNPEMVQTQRVGDRWIEDYDRGMVWALGGSVIGDDYYIQVDGVHPGFFDERDFRHRDLRGERMPGIHVIFAAPDDRLTAFSLPAVVVRRESVEIGESRWHGEWNLQYQVPAPGAAAVQIVRGGQTIDGWSSYEERRTAWPYDITYMISVMSQGPNSTREAQLMLKRVLRQIPPKAGRGIFARDSLGEYASYEAFSEGPQSLNEALDVADRQAGHSVNVRVQAMIDLRDPYFTTPATQTDFNMNQVP